MRILIKNTAFLIIFISLNSCNKYLDIVPDNIATIENAFTMRDQAEKYLFTCYSYMPRDGNEDADPAIMGGDEVWRRPEIKSLFDIAKGLQNKVSPLAGGHWKSLYLALRDCNVFLENIEKVPDISEYEKRKWIAEVKVLKAYYHFYLVRMYGPIPIVRESLPISTDVKSVKVYRDPVDECFSYIVELIDEARDDLPLKIDNEIDDLGRITLPIALSLKAKVLVTAASPLFNGNIDQITLKNNNGESLFNPEFSKEKWEAAALACEEAIQVCHSAGLKLYEFDRDFSSNKLTDTLTTQMSIRNSFTEKWNSEIIWANTQTRILGLQYLITPRNLDPKFMDNHSPRGEMSPPLKIVEMFYSKNGVPISEDKFYDYNNRYDLRTANSAEKLYIKTGYTSAYLNFEREPRFYASVGFDGGIWYGQGQFDDKKYNDLFFLEAKFGQRNGALTDRSTVTGYFVKKLVHYQNVIGSGTSYSVIPYPWTIMRLSDLYLLYSEALNEVNGPNEESYQYLNLIRARAGLESIEFSWDNFSNNPAKYRTRDGLREIIHQERMIELVFEGQRFWDLRRWKKASLQLNMPVVGFSVYEPHAREYYKPQTVFLQQFFMKEYFWPISEGDISVNKNLVQNLGW